MHSLLMLFAKNVRWLALCVLALGALGVHASAMQNAPLEKMTKESASCTRAQRAEVIDAPEENDCVYGVGVSAPSFEYWDQDN